MKSKAPNNENCGTCGKTSIDRKATQDQKAHDQSVMCGAKTRASNKRRAEKCDNK